MKDSFIFRRSFAAILDHLALLGILMGIGIMSSGTPEWTGNLVSFVFKSIPGFWASVTVWFVYFPIIESLLGYTLAKGLFDLEVVSERKSDFPFMVSIKRHLLDPFDFFLFGVPAILLVALSEDRKRLGDRWARSRVLKEGARIPVLPPVDPAILSTQSKIKYGGFWVRLGANFIDAMVMIPIVILFFFAGAFGSVSIKILTQVIGAIIPVAYTAVMHALYGATLGKMAVGLSVRALDFARIGWGEAIRRSSVDCALICLSTLGMIFTLLTIPAGELRSISLWEYGQVISAHQSTIVSVSQTLYNLWYWGEAIALLFSKRKRALHDFIAHTVVVEKDSLPDNTLI